MEAGLDRLARQPGKQDLTALGIFSRKNYHVFIWIHKQAGSVATILLIGMKIYPHKHSQAGRAGMNVQRC
jgi:hypothetical protein